MIFIDWLITREWLLRIFVNMTFLQKKNLCKQPTRIFGGFSFEQNLPSRRHWLTRQRSMRASSRILFVLTFLISCKATLSTPLSSSVNFSTFTYLTENVNSFLCEKANIQKTSKIGQKKNYFTVFRIISSSIKATLMKSTENMSIFWGCVSQKVTKHTKNTHTNPWLIKDCF